MCMDGRVFLKQDACIFCLKRTKLYVLNAWFYAQLLLEITGEHGNNSYEVVHVTKNCFGSKEKFMMQGTTSRTERHLRTTDKEKIIIQSR